MRAQAGAYRAASQSSRVGLSVTAFLDRKYSEDQARDNHGRWSGGGADVAALPGIAPQLFSSRPADVERVARDELVRIGMPKQNLIVLDSVGFEIKALTPTMYAAGQYLPSTGTIELFAHNGMFNDEAGVQGLVRHEAQHVRFDFANKANVGVGSFIIDNSTALRNEGQGGVSNYATAWWDRAIKTGFDEGISSSNYSASRASAVTETLSELHSRNGFFSPTYKKLDTMIQETWSRRHAPKLSDLNDRVDNAKSVVYLDTISAAPLAPPVAADSALKRTLYVSRPLLNADELIDWFKAQGFARCVPPEQMHVTIAFSREPVDWGQMASEGDQLAVDTTSSPPRIEPLGDKGAVVMLFDSQRLHDRWQSLVDSGCSWDYGGYRPHVTITYDGTDLDLTQVEPFVGTLLFGPEVFAEVEEDWDDNVVEKYSEDQPRDERGRFGMGVGGVMSDKPWAPDTGKTPLPPMHSKDRRLAVATVARNELDKLGMKGQIVAVDDKPISGIIGFDALGVYNSLTGIITLNSGHPALKSEEFVRQIVRHEGLHARFEVVKYVPKVSEFYFKNAEALRKEDGTTDYSKSWWSRYNKMLTASPPVREPMLWEARRCAVDESLAEMHAVGKVTPTYAKFDALISREYAARHARKALGIVRLDTKGSPDQPRDDHGRWTSGGDYAGDVPKGGFSATLPFIGSGMTFDNQRSQYPKKGPPGIGYFKGVIDSKRYVDCLLYRDKKGVVIGILNHFPKAMPPYEKKGNVTLFVDPTQQRQGIGSKLMREAGKRWNINLAQQAYTREGAALANALARRPKKSVVFLTLKRDDDGTQSRDDHGRWSSEGGGSALSGQTSEYAGKPALDVRRETARAKDGSRSVVEVAQILEQGDPISLTEERGISDQDRAIVRANVANATNQMEQEVRYQLDQVRSGKDWYHENTAQAFEITEKYLPTLKIDPQNPEEGQQQRVLFLAVGGIMSYSQDPGSSWDLACRAYEDYVRTGVIPSVNPENGKLWAGGPGASSKQGQLEMLNSMIGDLGERGTVDFLTGSHTNAVIADAREVYGGLKPGGGSLPMIHADEIVSGYMMFGPKASEFILSSNGTDAVAVDRWATRTLGRYSHDLTEMVTDRKTGVTKIAMKDAPSDKQRVVIKNMMTDVSRRVGIRPQQAQAVQWFFEQQLYNHMGASSKEKYFTDGAKRYAARREGGGKFVSVTIFKGVSDRYDESPTDSEINAAMVNLGYIMRLRCGLETVRKGAFWLDKGGHDVSDQPRDDHGRFSSGGGGDSTATETSQPKPAPAVDNSVSTYSSKVAEAIANFESRVRGEPEEHFVAIDKDGKEFFKSGSENSVAFTAEDISTMKAMAPEVFSHNHPKGYSFSPDDIALASHIGINEVRACVPSGGAFVIRGVPNEVEVRGLIQDMLSINGQQQANWEQRIRAGEISVSWATFHHHDEVWKTVAALPAWRDRLKYSFEGRVATKSVTVTVPVYEVGNEVLDLDQLFDFSDGYTIDRGPHNLYEDQEKIEKRDDEGTQPRDSHGRWSSGGDSSAPEGVVGNTSREWSPLSPSTLNFPGKFDGAISPVSDLDNSQRESFGRYLDDLKERVSNDTSNTGNFIQADSANRAIFYTEFALSGKDNAFIAIDKEGFPKGGAITHMRGGDTLVLDFLGSLQRGAGSQLLNQVEVYAKQNGAKSVILESTNYAEQFYLSRGYERSDDTGKYDFVKKISSAQGEFQFKKSGASDDDEPLGVLALSEELIHLYVPKIVKYSDDQARDDRGRWSTGAGGSGVGGVEMVSPNVHEGLTIDQVIGELHGQRAQNIIDQSREVDKILGIDSSHAAAVGAWVDGAENSILVTIPHQVSYDQIETSAAMKGMLADQKAVIPFRVELGGPDSMYRFTAPSSDMRAVHTELEKQGIEYHTLQPVGNGINVWVFDKGSEISDKVFKVGASYGTKAEVFKGRGDFLGGETRDQGRAAYTAVIERSLGQNQRVQWDRLYSGWRETNPVLHSLEALIEKYSDDQARDDHGRWSSGGGGGSVAETHPLQTEGPNRLLFDQLVAFGYSSNNHEAQNVHEGVFRLSDDDYAKNIAVAVAETDRLVKDCGLNLPSGISVVPFAPSDPGAPGETSVTTTWTGHGEAAMIRMVGDESFTKTYERMTFGPHPMESVTGEKILTPGWTVAQSVLERPSAQDLKQSIYRHELGHALFAMTDTDKWTQKNFYGKADAFGDHHLKPSISNETFAATWFAKNVSGYAASSKQESAAEMFAKFTSPGYVKGTLPVHFEKMVNHMLGKSRRAPRKNWIDKPPANFKITDENLYPFVKDRSHGVVWLEDTKVSKYSDDQVRDDAGRWTDGGGGDGGSGDKGGPVKESSSDKGGDKFDRDKWGAQMRDDMKGARAEWAALSVEQQDKYADATHSVESRVKEIVGEKEWPKTGSIQNDIVARVDQFRGSELTKEAADKISDYARGTHDKMIAADVDPAKAAAISNRVTDYLIAQDYEASGRSLGDHGIHHIAEDARVANEILAAGGMSSARSEAMISIAAAFHDAGYLTDPARGFYDEQHPRWGAQNYEANIAPDVRAAFGKEFDKEVNGLISGHAGFDLDWSGNAAQSAFSLADNLGIFHSDKMPSMVRYVPENTGVLVALARGKIDVEQAKIGMLANIEARGLPKGVSAQLKEATHEVTGVLPKYLLGTVGIRLDKVSWVNDHPNILMSRRPANEALSKVVDFGQKQFMKFAETYHYDPQKFVDSGNMNILGKGDTILMEAHIYRGGKMFEILNQLGVVFVDDGDHSDG